MSETEDEAVFYLVAIDEPASDVLGDLKIDAEWWTLREGLVLLHTDGDRSGVYHAVKRVLPEGSPLLVAPLADAPKFKLMAEGSLAWIRERSR